MDLFSTLAMRRNFATIYAAMSAQMRSYLITESLCRNVSERVKKNYRVTLLWHFDLCYDTTVRTTPDEVRRAEVAKLVEDGLPLAEIQKLLADYRPDQVAESFYAVQCEKHQRFFKTVMTDLGNIIGGALMKKFLDGVSSTDEKLRSEALKAAQILLRQADDLRSKMPGAFTPITEDYKPAALRAAEHKIQESNSLIERGEELAKTAKALKSRKADAPEAKTGMLTQ